MKRANSKLYDKRYTRWDGKVLVWASQRRTWLRDGVTVATYRYRDASGVLKEIEYDATVVKSEGTFFPSRRKYKKDGTPYIRQAFHTYDAKSLKIFSVKTIFEEPV